MTTGKPGCDGKRKYGTEALAQQVAAHPRAKLPGKTGGTPHVYRCEHCGCWHLAHMSPAEHADMLKRQALLGKVVIVRIEGRPPAVAKVVGAVPGFVIVRLRRMGVLTSGTRDSGYDQRPRRVLLKDVAREATPREVAVAMPIHELPERAA